MGNDEKFSSENLPFPVDGRVVGMDPDHPYSIRSRLRKICSDANSGNTEAIVALLQFTQQVIAEIDIDKEMSPDRIALASLKKPLQYLLRDKKAMLAAFAIPPKKSGRRKSKEIEERNKGFVKKIKQDMATDSTLTLKKAKEKMLKDINEAKDISTLDRVYREYVAKVSCEEIEANVIRILEEKYSDKKKQQ